MRSFLNKKQGSNGTRILLVLFLILTLFQVSSFQNNTALAQTPQELQDEITKLNNEINELNASLKNKRSEKTTLQNELGIFDNQIYAITLQIRQTEAELRKIEADIETIIAEIKKAEDELLNQKELLKENIRIFYEEGQVSSIEVVASSDNFSEYMDRTEYLKTLQTQIVETVDKINKLKEDLAIKKTDLEKKKTDVTTLKNQQLVRKQGLDVQRNAKNELLQRTKGEEAAFQKDIKLAQQKEAEFWAAYMAAIATSSASGGSTYKGGAGSGYLSMPSEGFLTQGYGCTDFAQCGNPYGPYGGKIHNGLDLSCGFACPIRSAAEGAILGSGYGSNGGWGNWIAVQHPNGLVTLYAHLSSINVSTGQCVIKGQVIGLEGNTGFSTGSHLHWSVYTNFVLYGNIPGYDGTVNPYTFL